MADVLAFLSSIQMHSDFQTITSHTSFLSLAAFSQLVTPSTWQANERVYTLYMPQHVTASLKNTIPLFLGVTL